MKVPTLTPVQSSNIQAVGYSNQGLFVRFIGGGTYHYPDAPKSVFDEMVKSDSVGRYFAHKIRGTFRHRPVDD